MSSSVESIVPLSEVSCLHLDRMAIDFWRVCAKPGAGGEYVSPDPRFVILLDGASMTLGSDDGESAEACSACFVPAGVRLRGRIGAARRLRHLDIHVDEDQLGRILGPRADLGSALFLPDSDELRHLCALLSAECRQRERPAGYSEALACGVIHEVFHLGARRRRARAAPGWLEAVTRHASENLDTPLSVERLAAMAGMSRATFHRRFKELVGVSPHQWVMRNRIQRAQALLNQGASFSHIANETGFADQAHFSRCFREATGLPPGQWVRRHESSKH